MHLVEGHSVGVVGVVKVVADVAMVLVVMGGTVATKVVLAVAS